MIKKILLVFGLALISQLIGSCINCHCTSPQTIYFTNKGTSLKNLDSSLPQPKVTSAGTISSTNYGIQIQLITQQITSRKQQISWGLIQSAYACSCVEDDYIAKEGFSSIKIFSDNDFDDTHPKGTDLSLYFKAKSDDTMISLADYLKSFKDFKYIPPIIFYEGVFLQVPPKSGKRHKFKVSITLSDGRILESETTEVELT